MGPYFSTDYNINAMNIYMGVIELTMLLIIGNFVY